MKVLSIEHSQKISTIIHDKIVHGKVVSPCFASKNNYIDMFTKKLSHFVRGMMAHGI